MNSFCHKKKQSRGFLFQFPSRKTNHSLLHVCKFCDGENNAEFLLLKLKPFLKSFDIDKSGKIKNIARMFLNQKKVCICFVFFRIKQEIAHLEKKE